MLTLLLPIAERSLPTARQRTRGSVR